MDKKKPVNAKPANAVEAAKPLSDKPVFLFDPNKPLPKEK